MTGNIKDILDRQINRIFSFFDYIFLFRGGALMTEKVPVWEKATLTLEEAAKLYRYRGEQTP